MLPSRNSQLRIVLPHFDEEVPLLIGPDGLDYVPLFALCRMLSLYEAYEIQRAEHVLLWARAALLPLVHHGRVCVAWCLSYPLDTGYWFGQVYGRVRDPRRRQQLKHAIHESMELSSRAQEIVAARFEAGRKRMYQLGQDAAHLRALATTLAEQGKVNSGGTDTQDKTRADVLDGEALAALASACCDQVERFVRDWFAALSRLPVIDGMRLADDGRVLDQKPFTLFGVMRTEDMARLDHYQQLVADLTTAVTEALRDDR